MPASSTSSSFVGENTVIETFFVSLFSRSIVAAGRYCAEPKISTFFAGMEMELKSARFVLSEFRSDL